jgi:hypothetical protein
VVCLFLFVFIGFFLVFFEKCTSGWEFINWLVKITASCEVNECGWKFVNWLVESISSYEVSEHGWKFINWLVENLKL